MVDHTSEELIYNIEADHEELQFMHETFAEILGGIIEQAQEVYGRDEIAKGLTDVATPGWDYFRGFNDRAAAEEEAEAPETWRPRPIAAGQDGHHERAAPAGRGFLGRRPRATTGAAG